VIGGKCLIADSALELEGYEEKLPNIRNIEPALAPSARRCASKRRSNLPPKIYRWHHDRKAFLMVDLSGISTQAQHDDCLQ
jgi:hypothetical protein